MMIFVDSNILSTFAKINRLDLLFKVFNSPTLYISSNIFQELKVSKKRGYQYTDEVFNLIKENKIEIITANVDELSFMKDMPKSFGSGELDSLTIYKNRNAVFLTNEKKSYQLL